MLQKKLTLRRRSTDALPKGKPRIVIDQDDPVNANFNATSQSPNYTEEYFDSPISPKISRIAESI